jgi:hypothetical protein
MLWPKIDKRAAAALASGRRIRAIFLHRARYVSNVAFRAGSCADDAQTQEVIMRKREAIRRLFLGGAPHYSVSDAAGLLGWSCETLMREICERELTHVGPASSLSWQSVALIAACQWSHEAIEDALGSNVSVLPPRLRLSDLRARVPQYQIDVIEAAARQQGTSVNDFLSRYLLDLSSVEAPRLMRTVQGFEEAYKWPASLKPTAESAA